MAACLPEQRSIFTEAATIISELQAENERLQRALMFWMPGVDLRLDEATRERAAQNAGLLAGYTEPLDGPCWGDGMLDRVLTAESAVAAAWDCIEKLEGGHQLLLAAVKAGDPPNEIVWRIEEELRVIARASAIRAAGGGKDG